MPGPAPANTKRSAAFFDVDRTLLPGSCLFPLAAALRRRGLISRPSLARLALDHVRYRWGGPERGSALARARRALLRAIAAQRRAILLDVATTVVNNEVRPRIYPRAINLIEAHREMGQLVFLASSSPQDYVDILADAIGADGAIGTEAESPDGIYTGRLVGNLAHGQDKAARVLELARERSIHLGSSVAYSDSVQDLPMLELVGNPVAVNPDRVLARIARRRQWPILRFEAPGSPTPAHPSLNSERSREESLADVGHSST